MKEGCWDLVITEPRKPREMIPDSWLRKLSGTAVIPYRQHRRRGFEGKMMTFVLDMTLRCL